jgi:hypothetical protein
MGRRIATWRLLELRYISPRSRDNFTCTRESLTHCKHSVRGCLAHDIPAVYKVYETIKSACSQLIKALMPGDTNTSMAIADFVCGELDQVSNSVQLQSAMYMQIQ